MKTWLCALLGMISFVGTLEATSVMPRSFECPVCGGTSIHNQLASYSNFDGPPARDRIFAPILGDVLVCPHDLFAAWDYRWGKLADAEQQNLAKLLERPAVDLTKKEMAIVGPHLDQLKQLGCWPILWLRTCDQAREPDQKNAEMTAMRLYFNGDPDSTEPWIRELSDHFRDEVIRALADTTIPQRRFLRAELLRQSGNPQEAAPIFRQLSEMLGKAPESPEDEDRRGERDAFKTLCDEGLLLIEAEHSSVERIAGWLMPEIPLDDEKEPPGWSRHRIAMQHLTERAIKGDTQASDALWKWLARHSERLLLMEATLENTPGAPRLQELRKAGGPWLMWFDELAAKPDSDDVPAHLGPDSPSYHCEVWQKNTLLPMVRKADATRQIPESGFNRDDLAFALASLLDEAISDRDRSMVMKTIIRVLKELPDPGKNPEYGFVAAVEGLAEHAPRFPSVQVEADGRWKSDWWKLLADYALGKPGLAPALANHPMASISFRDDGKAFEDLLWKLFSIRRDPVWKEKVILYLQSADWLAEEPVQYALAIDQQDLNDILGKMMLRREDDKSGVELWFTASYVIGNYRSQRRLAALPVR